MLNAIFAPTTAFAVYVCMKLVSVLPPAPAPIWSENAPLEIGVACRPSWLRDAAIDGPGVFAETLLDHADVTTLMAYSSDVAITTRWADQLLTLADARGARAEIAIEVSRSRAAPDETWNALWVESKARFFAALRTLDASLRAHRSFVGLALHELDVLRSAALGVAPER